MVCRINNKKVVEWTVNKEHINQIYTHLYDKVEYGGEIKLNFGTKNSSGVSGLPGKIDSVYAPETILNWHTHPIKVYTKFKYPWACPSNIDMVSSLAFALRGSACHLVSTVEGTYTIQINPCFITGLMNIDKMVRKEDYPSLGINIHDYQWGNFLRGLIAKTVDLYFESINIYRYTQILKEYHMVAEDFVKFANTFTLSNIFKKSSMTNCTSTHCTITGCNQNQQYNKQCKNWKSFIAPLPEYVSMCEKNACTYSLDLNGGFFKTDVNYLKILNNGGLKILEDLSLVLGPDCNIPTKAWHTTNMFKVQLFENEVYYKDEWRDYTSLDLDEKVEFLAIKRKKSSPVDIRLKADKITFSTFFDLTGDCNHENLVKHMKKYVNGKISRTVKSKSKSNMDKKSRTSRKTVVDTVANYSNYN